MIQIIKHILISYKEKYLMMIQFIKGKLSKPTQLCVKK